MRKEKENDLLNMDPGQEGFIRLLREQAGALDDDGETGSADSKEKDVLAEGPLPRRNGGPRLLCTGAGRTFRRP